MTSWKKIGDIEITFSYIFIYFFWMTYPSKMINLRLCPLTGRRTRVLFRCSCFVWSEIHTYERFMNNCTDNEAPNGSWHFRWTDSPTANPKEVSPGKNWISTATPHHFVGLEWKNMVAPAGVGPWGPTRENQYKIFSSCAMLNIIFNGEDLDKVPRSFWVRVHKLWNKSLRSTTGVSTLQSPQRIWSLLVWYNKK